MFSVAKINQNPSYFETLNFQTTFRVNNRFYNTNNDGFDQVFIGETLSFKRAIERNMTLQCFIDIGEELNGDFQNIASISLTWRPRKKECYFGYLWIEPDFRGNGLATYLINQICSYANELEIIVTLHAMPFVTPYIKPTFEDIQHFKGFFKQFGFKNCSKTGEIGFCNSMERLPS